MKRIFLLIFINTIFVCIAADKEQAYQKYLKKCRNHISLNLTEKNFLINDLANIVSDYYCNSYEQWLRTGWELVVAVRDADWEKVKSMLKKEIDVDATNCSGETPLMHAAIRGHKEITELLIDSGAAINAKDNLGRTALMHAAYYNSKQVAELLIAKKANINEKENSGWTVLMYAAYNNSKEVTELLIVKGADVNPKNDEGDDALKVAIKYSNKEIVEMLKKAGAKS